MNISRILWAFNIKKKIGEDGRMIEPTAEMTPGWLIIPEPFECTIDPRSEKHARIIEEVWKKTEARLEPDDYQMEWNAKGNVS